MAPFQQKRVPAHYRDPNYTTGRPSEYRPEYCQLVQDVMSEGFSLTAFAGQIRVAKETVYEWIRRHSEFSDAVSRARVARVRALEAKLLRSRKGAETTAAIFALRNADPTEWRDIKHTTHDHNHKIEQLTDAQLFAIASGKQPVDGQVIDGECERVDTG
ncbi:MULTISPECIES: hypothetical protein [unclassified Bradyrhizobium]|uniref:hypothetical protein n=1 Tax=unclassified Bradyrhizobium TaxID=2631580 RepID=UPI002FEFCBC7